jgi:hypothetical protein
MGKTLSSLIAVSALAGLATAASAAGNDPGFGTATGYDSIHTGSVVATCSLDVTDGALPTGQGFVNSLTSTTKGKISTVCNSTGSTLKVELAPGVHPVQPNYTERFRLTGGTGVYATGLPTGFIAGPYNRTNLSNGFSSAVSTIDVTARASVPTSQVLAVGTYTVNVKATVTP